MSAERTGAGDLMLDNALRRAGALIGAAQALAFALGDELGAIDIPPSTASDVDQAQLRAVASLYLASELEGAGVLASVETLAGVSRGASAGIQLDFGKAAPLVADFWRHRNDRPTADERGQAFARLFGDGFENRMLDLCEALYKLDELATNPSYGGIAQQARARNAASALVETVVGAAGSVTVFLAQEIMEAIKQALAILGHPDLRGAFGARDVWGAIAGIDRMTHGRRADPRLFVRRGRAGMTVLAWVADAAPHLDSATPLLVGLDHPVIPAAVDWMEAALAIGEAGDAAPGAAAPAPAAPPASPWAAMAA